MTLYRTDAFSLTDCWPINCDSILVYSTAHAHNHATIALVCLWRPFFVGDYIRATNENNNQTTTHMENLRRSNINIRNKNECAMRY